MTEESTSRICVKGLPPYVDEPALREHFSEKGEVTDAKVVRAGFVPPPPPGTTPHSSTHPSTHPPSQASACSLAVRHAATAFSAAPPSRCTAHTPLAWHLTPLPARLQRWQVSAVWLRGVQNPGGGPHSGHVLQQELHEHLPPGRRGAHLIVRAFRSLAQRGSSVRSSGFTTPEARLNP